ncbi:MAG: hypothetical protein ACI9JM_001731 [Halioglobus sp.]
MPPDSWNFTYNQHCGNKTETIAEGKTMDTTTLFLAYASEFEKSYADNEWERLYEFLQPDATYEVVSEKYGCTLVGPEAIFRGTKKSLDGLDRRFEKRTIQPKDDIQSSDNEFSISWIAIYEQSGLPTLELHGHSHVLFRDGKIQTLTDSYTPEGELQVQAWLDENDFPVDLSYI